MDLEYTYSLITLHLRPNHKRIIDHLAKYGKDEIATLPVGCKELVSESYFLWKAYVCNLGPRPDSDSCRFGTWMADVEEYIDWGKLLTSIDPHIRASNRHDLIFFLELLPHLVATPSGGFWGIYIPSHSLQCITIEERYRLLAQLLILHQQGRLDLGYKFLFPSMIDLSLPESLDFIKVFAPERMGISDIIACSYMGQIPLHFSIVEYVDDHLPSRAVFWRDGYVKGLNPYLALELLEKLDIETMGRNAIKKLIQSDSRWYQAYFTPELGLNSLFSDELEDIVPLAPHFDLKRHFEAHFPGGRLPSEPQSLEGLYEEYRNKMPWWLITSRLGIGYLIAGGIVYGLKEIDELEYYPKKGKSNFLCLAIRILSEYMPLEKIHIKASININPFQAPPFWRQVHYGTVSICYGYENFGSRDRLFIKRLVRRGIAVTVWAPQTRIKSKPYFTLEEYIDDS